jgi:(p)ppGpp synthase/HD superfamily hydrolase
LTCEKPMHGTPLTEIEESFLAAIGENPTVQAAHDFARRAHASVGQVRKYTGEPYIVHPVAVAERVRTVAHDDAMLAAALMHDVVEDTPVTLARIEERFGADIAELVDWLTDISKPEDGNRAVRKRIDLLHTEKASPQAKTIKLADIIDNTITISRHDPNFWRRYRRECLDLLGVMREGDPDLWELAAEKLQMK